MTQDGKWTVVHDFNIVDDFGRLIASTGGIGTEELRQQQIDNAHTIAALPELLAACRAAIVWFLRNPSDTREYYYDPSRDDLIDQLTAAIAAARGKD